MSRISRHAIAACAAAAASLCGPAVADAATVTLDHPCYYQTTPRQKINFRGAGFVPNAQGRASFAGQTVGGPIGPTGAFSAGGFPTPRLTRNQQRFTLSVTDGTNHVNVPVNVTKVFGDFNPSTGRPETLRVRILVQGLGAVLESLHRNRHGTIYAHYIRPNGKLKANRRLGRLSGVCGAMITCRIRLLPYSSELGTWRVYLDTNPGYKRREVARVSIAFAVRQP
jgi:hypothetical protein